MKKHLALPALLLALLPAAAGCARRDVIIMVGESTTYGQSENSTQIPTNAAATLEFLLSKIDYPCPYADLPVENWAVSGTNTRDWFTARPDVYCAVKGITRPLIVYACEHGGPLADAVRPLAEERGERIKLLLVNAQGTNDAHIAQLFSPETTVDSIAKWPGIMAPIPVMISPPFFREDIADTLVTRFAKKSSAELAAYVKQVRELELARGLITGPDWGVVFPHPPFQSDGFHITDGGSAVAAGYWLDKLCPRPIPPPFVLPPLTGSPDKASK